MGTYLARNGNLRLMLKSLVTILIFAPVPVADANFFSRLMKFGSDDDKKPAPSGASAARGTAAQVGSIITFENGAPFVHLANNNKVPLVGLGVGNLQHDLIPSMVAEAIQDDKRSYLIDTARASNNEDLVAEGLLKGVERLSLPAGERLQVHVVTKVWYTHLGYERTKLSVEESMDKLAPALNSDKLDVRLHILLHWPRCFDEIPWMNCEKDEAELPSAVKNAGPDPTKNPDAWKESWKYLEDLYLSDQYPIASVGVSNFNLHDLESMESFARLHPHILQVNLWSLLYDAQLVEYCHKQRIHVQVYNAMQGTIMQPEYAPRAFHHIQKIAYEISKEHDLEITPGQIVLAWLIQHGITVIPRTSKMERLKENSAVEVSKVPALNDIQVESVAHAVEAYLSGDDLKKDIHVSVTFHAVNKDILIYWVGHDERSETRVALLRKGESFKETTYPNHKFRTYDTQNRDIYIEHEIEVDFGGNKDIHVEL